MKVKIEFTVEVDLQAWKNSYHEGSAPPASELRKDLQNEAKYRVEKYIDDFGLATNT